MRVKGKKQVLAATVATVTATALIATALPSPATPAALTARSAPGTLPPLDDAALRKAITIQPSDKVTGALLRITGDAGHWRGTSGEGDVTTHAKVPPDGMFRVGSVSKVFTAAVVLQLVAEHRIDLKQTVQHYLPGLLPDAVPDVTVGQLLNHTSGLPNDTSPFVTGGDAAWFVRHRFDIWTPAQIVAIATRHPMLFKPGTAQLYEGINYYLAGLLIEQVTGDSYADEVRRRVIRPLRLRHTDVPAFSDFAIHGPHSHGYVAVGGTLKDVTEESPWAWAEGGIISSAPDLDRFITALFQGKVVPKPQLAQMFTLPVDAEGDPLPYTDKSNCPDGKACFGMGLMSARLPGIDGDVWGKTGSRPGYTDGVFATRDLSRRAVYALNPTGNKDGSEMTMVMRIAMAVFAGK